MFFNAQTAPHLATDPGTGTPDPHNCKKYSLKWTVNPIFYALVIKKCNHSQPLIQQFPEWFQGGQVGQGDQGK
jgi:hypothetical protein